MDASSVSCAEAHKRRARWKHIGNCVAVGNIWSIVENGQCIGEIRAVVYRIGRGSLDKHLHVSLDNQFRKKPLRAGALETALKGVRGQWEVFAAIGIAHHVRIPSLIYGDPNSCVAAERAIQTE